VEGVRIEDMAAEGTPGKYRVWYTLPGKTRFTFYISPAFPYLFLFLFLSLPSFFLFFSGSGKYIVKASLNGKNIKGLKIVIINK
jgi:hypothetical protein